MTNIELGEPGGSEPSALTVDGWGVRRADAFALLTEAEKISKSDPAEAQTLALVGIGHALLALDDRLANQPPPIWVVNSSGDLESDREFVEQLRQLVTGSPSAASKEENQ